MWFFSELHPSAITVVYPLAFLRFFQQYFKECFSRKQFWYFLIKIIIVGNQGY